MATKKKKKKSTVLPAQVMHHGLFKDAKTVNDRENASIRANKERVKAAEAAGKKFLKPWEVMASLDAKKASEKKHGSRLAGAAVRQMGGSTSLPVKIKAVRHATPGPSRKIAKTSGASVAGHAAHLQSVGSEYAKQARKGLGESLKHVNKTLGRTTNAAHGVGGAAGRQATTHTLQRGKKGGSFYVVNGRKVYAKK